jgi:hypothetical protein
MTQLAVKTVILRSVAIAALTIAAGGIALGDDTPTPPAKPAPGGRHHDPAWAACKKQADDQKLERGDARREFMKSCIAKSSGTPPSS